MRKAIDASDREFRGARLTWNPGSIAPFESAWSVFAKVMATNFLTWEELRRLLSEPSPVAEMSENEFLSCQWLSLDTYASLLRESRAAIEMGFLDALGFPKSLLHARGIRQCPECTRAGYHCTLFSLGALTHCPWHRCPLTRGCVKCGMAVRRMDPRHLAEVAVCPECSTRIVDLPRCLLGITDSQLRQTAEDCCKRIVAWWRAVSTKEPTANDLLGDALGSMADGACGDYVKLKWGAAIALEPPPECWPARGSCTAATVVKWQEPSNDAVHHDHDTWETLVTRYYRSVRRHIFRNFIRPHRRCLAFLTSAQHPVHYCLDREHACTVCIAYISWRRANEQPIAAIAREFERLKLTEEIFAHGDFLRTRTGGRARRFSGDRPALDHARQDQSIRPWALRQPSLNGLPLSADLVPRLLYAEFLRIWMELEVDNVDANVRIEVNPLMDGGLRLPVAEGNRCSARSIRGARVFTVVLPDKKALAGHAAARCENRRLYGQSMVNAHAEFNADGFGWGRREPASLLFKLRCRHGSDSRIYTYVCP